MSLAGTFQEKKKDGTIYYRSSITYRNKHISLGSYDTEYSAHLAYVEGRNVLNGSATIQDYKNANSVLPFDKWVSLINFRNTGLYFKTPIQLFQKHFLYHFSPAVTFTFDTDDLFYYSSHKIMARQGHYFVSDYGMQVNIFSRYGIKNYSVKNRDYRHINGDEFDFRYENLEIINRFHGVFRTGTPGNYTYKAKIHIRSTYVIGTFADEITAAIAYNKAIDTLRDGGLERNFTENYIENLSGKEYAEIYSKIEMPKRIREFVTNK